MPVHQLGRMRPFCLGGENRRGFLLDTPILGVYLQPMVWGIQYKYSADAILLVFTTDYYDASDYVRDYDEFNALIKASNES